MPRSPIWKKAYNPGGENRYDQAPIQGHFMGVPELGIGPAPKNQSDRWKKARDMRFRQKNGFDPISFMHLLDWLMNTDVNLDIWSGPLATNLNNNFQNLAWDPKTVGTMLGDITDAFEEVLGENRGLLLRGSRFSRGWYFRVQYNPDIARVARRAMDELLEMARLAVLDQERGSPLPNYGPIHAIHLCPSLRGSLNGDH